MSRELDKRPSVTTHSHGLIIPGHSEISTRIAVLSNQKNRQSLASAGPHITAMSAIEDEASPAKRSARQYWDLNQLQFKEQNPTSSIVSLTRPSSVAFMNIN